jgi:hypothetical protein
MPPLEGAIHDSEKNDRHELFLMCDDLAATLIDLKSKQVTVSDASEQRRLNANANSSRDKEAKNWMNYDHDDSD